MFFPLCRRGLQYLFNEVVIWLPYNFAVLSEVLALPRCNTDALPIVEVKFGQILGGHGCQPVARDGRFIYLDSVHGRPCIGDI